MNYAQTLDYLFSRLPMFQRIGAAAYKADLDNTLAICKALGNPEKKLKCIHIAGTNGKGSSSHMLASILHEAGYKTGLYTSPHLKDFRERVRINGKMIPKQTVTDFVEQYKAVFEAIEPSFFEWTVGLAFHYFEQEEVDIAVIETGLGGRLDSTNVITPVVSLITNIGWDHMNLLGDTLQKIAGEKAGIIKPRIPVVLSQYQPETAPVFTAIAKEQKAPLVFAEKDYKVLSVHYKEGLQELEVMNRATEVTHGYQLDLNGSYQQKNILGVLATIEVLKEAGFLIEDRDVERGLRQVMKNTGLQGRWQTLGEKPTIIVDTGHNEDGIHEVLENLKRYTYKKLHIVLGMVNDKDHAKILKLLPKDATYYFCKASVPRALNEAELAAQAQKHGLHGKTYPDVPSALEAAKKQAKATDLIFVGGSTFTVADAL